MYKMLVFDKGLDRILTPDFDAIKTMHTLDDTLSEQDRTAELQIAMTTDHHNTWFMRRLAVEFPLPLTRLPGIGNERLYDETRGLSAAMKETFKPIYRATITLRKVDG